MKLYNATYYHGSGANFDKFDFKFMSSGEGHQVHGWGLYFAEDKEIVTERYGERLANRRPFIDITIDNKHYEYAFKTDWERLLLDDVSSFPQALARFIDDEMSMEDVLYRIDREIIKNEGKGDMELYVPYVGETTRHDYLKLLRELLDYIEEHDVTYKFNAPKATIFTIEVPDDLIFVEEETIVDELPDDIKTKINDVVNEQWGAYVITDGFKEVVINSLNYNTDVDKQRFLTYVSDMIIAMFRTRNKVTSDELLDKLKYLEKDCEFRFTGEYDKDELTVAQEIVQYADINVSTENACNGYFSGVSFEWVYRKLSMGLDDKRISLSLEQHGINGITYFGNTDGRCYVIFNPNNINIISKE